MPVPTNIGKQILMQRLGIEELEIEPASIPPVIMRGQVFIHDEIRFKVNGKWMMYIPPIHLRVVEENWFGKLYGLDEYKMNQETEQAIREAITNDNQH